MVVDERKIACYFLGGDGEEGVMEMVNFQALGPHDFWILLSLALFLSLKMIGNGNIVVDNEIPKERWLSKVQGSYCK